MKQTFKLSWVLFGIVLVLFSISCKKKTTEPGVIASFTYKVDTSNFMQVTFTNASSNFSTVAWDFGDGGTSTENNPVHIYTAVGSYTVTLTAIAPSGGTDSYHQDITISDPNAELTKLTGTVSKVWKLIRKGTTGRYPLECGPIDHKSIWWAMGYNNDELAKRPCLLNDEWTFGRDKSLKIDLKGDIWRESQGWFADPVDVCGSTSDPLLGPAGEDLTPWAGGNFTFELNTGSAPTLTAVGLGAYIGHFKLGNGAETKVPIDHVTYNLIQLTDVDNGCDTLIVEGTYNTGTGYWRYVLVHYDNPADEPPIPGNKPSPSFTYSAAGLVVTFTNTTTEGDTYSWDFGDGQTSPDQNPTHTYTAQGPYSIVLTATNANGSATAKGFIFLGSDLTTFTDAQLIGAAWKVYVAENSIFVGGAMGSNAWWALPKSFLETGTGVDNWTCMPDDEFTFSTGGGYSYDTKGSARNDGYFGGTNGCIDDAGIAASGNGAAFGSCSTHTYVLTPGTATANPIITLTNGASHAAFIGFYKGYYGGENTNSANPPNGGFTTNIYQVMGYANTGSKEFLFVSVDLTADHTGGSAWSAILTR